MIGHSHHSMPTAAALFELRVCVWWWLFHSAWKSVLLDCWRRYDRELLPHLLLRERLHGLLSIACKSEVLCASVLGKHLHGHHVCAHGPTQSWAFRECFITPCACVRGNVIGSVVVVIVVVVVVVVNVVVISTKIAKSQKIGIWQSALCHQTVKSHEKLCSVHFKSLRKTHEHYKSCVFTGHAYRPRLAMHMHVCVLFPLRMLNL